MKSVKTGEPVLGIMVTGRALQGVLVRLEAEGPVVLHRLVRQRNARPSHATHPAGAAMSPAMAEEVAGGDFTIQFGENGTGGAPAPDFFLKSEFSGFQTAEGNGALAAKPQGFIFELAEMLDECRRAGYENPAVAFCAAASEVAHVELTVVEKDKGKGKAPARRDKEPSREALLALLAEQYKGEIEPERVAFIPLASTETGGRRYLAQVARPTESVAATLQAIRKQKEERMPSVRLLDSETSLYLGLARTVQATLEAGAAPAGGEQRRAHTLVVRAGAEDTLLMFLEGDRLRHFENMRSLTAFDSPDTICSRVLLQQDEYGVEDVQNILVLSDEHEEELKDSFRAFFPDANVASLRECLPVGGDAATQEAAAAAQVPALAVALRALGTPALKDVFYDVNLLPRRLIRQKVELPVTWHVLVLGVVLFAVSLFFGGRYITMEQKIDHYRDNLRAFPPSLADEDPRVLQSRIDSMQTTYNGYVRALSVLDTLLVGSDRWSRTLEDVSNEAAAVRGIWIESWTPGGNQVQMTGNATSRDRVVALAERLGAEIETLSFSEVREWPVYLFTMRMPVEDELPEAARYLRERSLADVTSGSGTSQTPVQNVSSNQ